MQSSYKVIKNDSVKKLDPKEIVTDLNMRYVCVDIENSGKEHIESYENLVKNMLENARKKGEVILQKAYEEAKKIQEDAYTAAKELNQQAYESGFSKGQEAGFNKAYYEAIESTRVESQNIINNAEELFKNAKIQYENYLQDKANELKDLIVAIAEKVLKKPFESKDAIDSLIYEALEASKNSRNFIIRCNGIYVDELKSQVNNWKEQLGFAGDIFVLKDDSIEKGNAFIDKGNGKIEVGAHSALNKIREILEGKD